jgi:hypothetical protein
MSGNYHYEFPNLKHHGMVNICDKQGNFILDIEIWACRDFTRDEYEDIGFCCSRCCNRFSKKHLNKPVSDEVLRELGIIEEQEREVRAE